MFPGHTLILSPLSSPSGLRFLPTLTVPLAPHALGFSIFGHILGRNSLLSPNAPGTDHSPTGPVQPLLLTPHYLLQNPKAFRWPGASEAATSCTLL